MLSLASIRILLVEDDRIDQMAFRKMLVSQDHSYDTKIASNVKEAKAILETDHFDIIVSDYFLGDGTAFDVMSSAKGIPVILITGAGDEDTVIKALRSGASDYLVKSSDYSHLKALPKAIETAIELKYSSDEIKKLSLIASQAFNGIVVTDIAGKVEWLNDSILELLDNTRENALSGKLTPDGVRLVFQPDIKVLYERISREKRSISIEAELEKDGHADKYILVTLTPLLTSDGNEVEKVISIFTDITHRKKIEEELIKAKNEAEEAKKAEEIFIANTSHEVRTPMNGILGMSELLLRTPLDSEQLEYISAIKQSAQSLLSIINDILDFSKIRAGQFDFEKIDFKLADHLNSISFAQKVRAEQKHIGYKIDISSELPDVAKGDPTRLNQIMLNLLSNAIKYTEEGEVTFRAEAENKTSKGFVLKLSIIDSGIGIPQDKLGDIFKSFKQAGADTSRKYGGTGLGLAIVQQLLEYQGGRITVESTIGKGSTFTAFLPMEYGDAEQVVTDHKAPLAIIPFSKPYHFLIAEDNIINQKVISSIIEQWGASFNIANNGKEALEFLESGNSYDMILMDLRMPEMDGIEATRRIRKHTNATVQKIPIIALTASAMETERNECLAIGMNDYVSKPIAFDQLYAKIVAFLGDTAALDEGAVPVSPNRKVNSAKHSLFDLAYLSELADNRQDFMNEIVETFIEAAPEDLSKLENALNTEDWKTVSDVAHKLKSSLSMMGIKLAYERAKLVQDSATLKNDLKSTVKDSQFIISTTKNAIEQLKEYLHNQ